MKAFGGGGMDYTKFLKIKKEKGRYKENAFDVF